MLRWLAQHPRRPLLSPLLANGAQWGGQATGRSVTASGAVFGTRSAEVPGTTVVAGGGASDFALARAALPTRAEAIAEDDAIPPLLARPARPPASGPNAIVPARPTRSSVITTLSPPLRFHAARTSVPVAADLSVAFLVPTAGPESTTTTSGSG